MDLPEQSLPLVEPIPFRRIVGPRDEGRSMADLHARLSTAPKANLRLVDEPSETDAIPFPGAGRADVRIGRAGIWPRLVREPAQHPAERALADVERHFEALRAMLHNDDDRPRAA